MRKRAIGKLTAVLLAVVICSTGLTSIVAEAQESDFGTLSIGTVLKAGDIVSGSNSDTNMVVAYYEETGVDRADAGVTVFAIGVYNQKGSITIEELSGISNWEVFDVRYIPKVTESSIDYCEIKLCQYQERLEPNTGGEGLEPNTGGGHEHNFEWEIVKEPTEYEDGLMRYRCAGCGATEDGEGVFISAYGSFNRTAADKIRKAPADGAVAIEAGQWISFTKEVLDTLKERVDVTLTVTFKDKGCLYTFTIPAGGTDRLTGEADYYGFYYLAGIFGVTEK